MGQLRFLSSSSEVFAIHAGVLGDRGLCVYFFTYLIVFQTEHLLSLEGAPSRGSFEIKGLLLKTKQKSLQNQCSVLFSVDLTTDNCAVSPKGSAQSNENQLL